MVSFLPQLTHVTPPIMAYPAEGEGNATLFSYYDDGPTPAFFDPIDIDTERKIISLNYAGFPQVTRA